MYNITIIVDEHEIYFNNVVPMCLSVGQEIHISQHQTDETINGDKGFIRASGKIIKITQHIGNFDQSTCVYINGKYYCEPLPKRAI